MTRLMGDATHDNAHSLPFGLQLVAGYDTGTPDIKWTGSDWAIYPSLPNVHIDQGGLGAPVYSATVQDVESFKLPDGTTAWTWTVASVPGWQAKCTAPRPTVYCDRDTLALILAETRWRGELWLAIPDWKPGDPLPPLDGCTVVAVQNDYTNPLFDLSVVLDPTWPGPKQEAEVITIPGVPGKWLSVQQFTDLTNQTPYVVGLGLNGAVYMTKRVNGAWTQPVRL